MLKHRGMIGVEAIGTAPEALADLMKSDATRLGKAIRDAGIRGDMGQRAYFRE